MIEIHKNVLNILTRSAKFYGFEYQNTIEGFDKAIIDHRISGRTPQFCTFLFRLGSDRNKVIGFDWASAKPDIVRTVKGSFPSQTPINLSYISSHKILNQFFENSKEKLLEPVGMSCRGFFGRVRAQ